MYVAPSSGTRPSRIFASELVQWSIIGTRNHERKGTYAYGHAHDPPLLPLPLIHPTFRRRPVGAMIDLALKSELATKQQPVLQVALIR